MIPSPTQTTYSSRRSSGKQFSKDAILEMKRVMMYNHQLSKATTVGRTANSPLFEAL
jgi:hypothetical protein